ncbi:MAG TPA: oligosaccharide flippase family protein [Aeromicrobium sp.]|nr:oligosaccharide flippase family protein [Aeromicrobium sp.]
MVRGTLSTAVVRLVMAAASFVTLGIAARGLTPDEFGLVAVMSSIVLLLMMFDFGIGGALTMRVATSHGNDDLLAIRGHVNNALVGLTVVGTVIALGGAVSAVTMPWHAWTGGPLDVSTVTRCLVVTFVIGGASLPGAAGLVTLSAMQRFTAAQMSIAAGSVGAVVTTAVVAPFDPPPEVFLLTILGSPLVVSLAFTLWTRFGVLGGLGSSAFDRSGMAEMLRVSGWYAIYTVANTVTIGTGTMVVGSVLSLAEAGIFNVAVRLFTPVITVVTASGAQLRPGMTEALARGDVAWARSRYRRGLFAAAAASTVISLVLVVLGRWFARIWVGEDLVPPLSLLAWSAAFTIILSIAAQYAILILAVERIRPAAALAVCTAAAAIGGSVVLARAVGLDGAMIAAVAAILLIFIPGITYLSRDTLRSLDAIGAD